MTTMPPIAEVPIIAAAPVVVVGVATPPDAVFVEEVVVELTTVLVDTTVLVVDTTVVLLVLVVGLDEVELFRVLVMLDDVDELKLDVGRVVTTSCVYVVKLPIVTVCLKVVKLGFRFVVLGEESTNDVWIVADRLPCDFVLPLPLLQELSK